MPLKKSKKYGRKRKLVKRNGMVIPRLPFVNDVWYPTGTDRPAPRQNTPMEMWGEVRAAREAAARQAAGERKAGTPAYKKWLENQKSKPNTLSSDEEMDTRTADKRKQIEDSNDLASKKRKGRGKSVRGNRTGSVVHGKMGTHFKRTRRTKYSKFSKYGVQLTYETRDSVNDPQCVYICAGTPTDQIWRAAWFCIVKRLFLIAGIEVENYDASLDKNTASPAGFKYTFLINYWANVGAPALATPITYVHDFTANKITYVHAVDNILDALNTAFSVGTTLPQFHEIELYQGNTAEGNYGVSIAHIPFAECKLDMSMKAKLILQNVTQATGGTGDAKLSTDRIDINPLKGIKYETTYPTNCILPRIRDETTQASYLAFMPNFQTGITDIQAASLAGLFSNYKEGMAVGFYKPPAPKSLLGVKAAPARIEPGEIKQSYYNWRQKLKFTTLIEKLYDQWIDRSGTTYVKFGKVQMFAFEHALCQAAEQNVSIDYQFDFTIGCTMYYKKPHSVPIVRIAQ